VDYIYYGKKKKLSPVQDIPGMKVYDGPDGPEMYLTDPRFSEGGNWLELMVKAKMVCRKVKITYRESPDICPQVFIVAPFKLIQSVMGWEVEDLPTEAKEPRRFSEEQERERAEMDRKEKRNENIEKIVFKVITLLIAVKLAYHIYALATKSGGLLWEHILWIVISLFLLVISSLILMKITANILRIMGSGWPRFRRKIRN